MSDGTGNGTGDERDDERDDEADDVGDGTGDKTGDIVGGDVVTLSHIKSRALSSSEVESATARSIKFLSSRTLPGN